MRIEVLGPLRVVDGDRVVGVGGVRSRALLARLALAGSAVSAHALVAAVWPEQSPKHPEAALHSLVSRLRRALPDSAELRAETAGYRLDVPAETIDAVRFERSADRGRRALRAGRLGVAEELLTEALDLWRGEPLADLAHLSFAAAAAARWTEIRLGAVEDRIEAMLAGPTGHTGLCTELNQLLADHPLRERLRELLIRALIADGEQTAALSAYEDYRAALATDLGADPGPELRRLHLRLLRGDTERVAGNVRAPLTSFFGRAVDRRQVVRRLRDERLVTLVGPGGVGKTRLATEVGADLAVPVWLVELAASARPDDLPRTVAAALGLRESADATAGLVEFLASAQTVLIFDGCEHVIDHAAQLAAELLGRCPRVRILATSREPLGISGETLYPVSPLAPGPAVRLFTERARAVQPAFVATDTVDRICRRLDCLPLAIELAAVRLRSMSIDALAAGLDDRFRLLTGGSRTAPPRHRTLRAVVAWSWDLLTDTERAAADRLAVFPASFTSAAAESICVPKEDLYALVDKSLLDYVDGRYRMLDTVREFGLDRLTTAGTLAAARAAHATCFLELAERAEPYLRGTEQLSWLTCLAGERHQFDAALAFSRDTADSVTAVRLGAALGQFWAVHGDHAEAAGLLSEILCMPGEVAPDTRLRATAGYLLNALFAGSLGTISVPRPVRACDPVSAFVFALLALADGALDDGIDVLEPHLRHHDPWTRGMLWFIRALLRGAAGRDSRGDLIAAVDCFRVCGERWAWSLSLMSLAHVSSTAGDADAAKAMLDEAARLSRELGTHDGQRAWLAMVRIDAGDVETARTELTDLLACDAASHEYALAHISLADLARYEGDLDAARIHLGSVADAAQPPERALYAAGAGYLAAATGEFDTAARYLGEARDIACTLPDLPMLAHVAVGLADLAHRGGRPAQASEILGVAHALRGGPNSGHPDVARLTRALREFRADYRRGSALDPADALERVRMF
ncbi:BTAD domain-containing putative transcriptional regulator [Nocardia sp. NPDC127579]|uniref:BTAD domain-containing putative transcriptional regulator n=1 Tax=Nocardia sp. NPDC127579 TaxID=3345402 RepID=UPI00363738FF